MEDRTNGKLSTPKRGQLLRRFYRASAKGDHAAALAAYQAERHARYTADHARWNAELLALVATGEELRSVFIVAVVTAGAPAELPSSRVPPGVARSEMRAPAGLPL